MTWQRRLREPPQTLLQLLSEASKHQHENDGNADNVFHENFENHIFPAKNPCVLQTSLMLVMIRKPDQSNVIMSYFTFITPSFKSLIKFQFRIIKYFTFSANVTVKRKITFSSRRAVQGKDEGECFAPNTPCLFVFLLKQPLFWDTS